MTNVPIEEQLGFSIEDALSAIRTVDDALQQVVQSFAVGLSSALETLTSAGTDVPSLAESLDVAGLGPAVDAALAEADTVIPVEADTSAAVTSIDELTPDGPIPVDVDADTDTARSEIDSLQSAPPVEVEVDADLSAAQTALDDLAADPVPLTADTSAVESGIADVVDVPRDVRVDADVSGVSDAIESATDAAVTVEVEGDTAALVDAVEAVTAVDVTVPVDADTSQAESSITALSDAVPVDVPVTADTTEAQAQIDQVGIGATVDVPVSADTEQAATEIDQLGAGVTLTVPVDADTADLVAGLEAATDVSAVIPVDGDVAGLDAAIEQAIDVTATIPVDADVSAATDAITGLEEESITVSIEADTDGFNESVTGLDSAAEGATGSVLDLSSATTGFTAAAALGRGEASGLGAAASSLGPAVGGVAAGFAAGAATVSLFFKQAIVTEGALLRLDQTFGSLKSQIETLKIGDLNADLAELALSLGSDDDALRNIAASLFQFQTGAGTSDKEALKFSQTVLALSARAVALNPTLGNVEDVANRLGNTFARGGRFLSQYQISLAAVDIKARAAENAERGLGDGVSQAALQIAGAQLALERYGNSLEEDIARGTENPIIQLRALRVKFDEAAEAIGKPLVAPIFDLLVDLEPVAESVAEVIGSLAQVVLPALQGLATGLGLVEPPLSLLSDGLGFIADLGTPAALAITALGVAAFAAQLPFFGLAAAAAAFGTALTIATGPIGIVVAGLAAVGLAARLAADGTAQAAVDTTALKASFDETGDSADSFGENIGAANTAIDAYLDKQLKLGDETETQAEVVSRLGLSFSDLKTALTGTDTQFDTILGRLVDTTTGTDDVDSATNQLIDTLAFGRQQLLDNAQAALLLAESSGLISSEQLKAAEANNVAAISLDGFGKSTIDYLAVQRELAPQIRAVKQDMIDQGLATGRLQQAFLDLKPAIADGTLTAEDAQQVATDLGISLEDAEAAVSSLSTAMDSFVSTGLSALPSAGAAVEEFASGIEGAEDRVASALGGTAEEAQKANDALLAAFDPQLLIDAQNKQIFAIASFQNSIQTLIQRGQENAAAQLIAQGPAGGGAEAALALVNDETKARAFDNGVITASRVRDGYRQFLSDPAVKAELSDTLVTLADGSVVNVLPLIEANAAKVGQAFITGISTPLNASPEVKDAVQRLAEGGAAAFDPNLAAPAKAAAAQAGVDAQAGFKEGFDPAGTATAQVGKIPAAIQTSIQPAVTASGIAGTGLTAAFATNLHFAGEVSANLANIPERFERDDIALTAAGIAGVTLGLAFGAGFAAGIEARGTDVSAAAGALASKADDAVRRRLGIESPSKAGIDIGEQYVAGIAQGLAALGPVEQATAALTLALVPDLRPALKQTPSLAPGIAAQAPTVGALAGAFPNPPAPDASANTRLVKAEITVNKTDPDPKHFADELAWMLQ